MDISYEQQQQQQLFDTREQMQQDQSRAPTPLPMDLNQLLGLNAAPLRQDERPQQQQQDHRPPVLAPQPQLPPPPQQPVPEFALGWAHPANMTSSVIGSSAQPISHIIATPSWTAMFPDPPLPQQPPASSAPNQQQRQQQQQVLQNGNPFYQPFSPPPAPPSVISNGSTSHTSQQFNVGVPFGMGNPFSNASAALFQLPPATTLFPDVNQTLTSAATSTGGTTSAFYSSYGVYQPVQGPYPRFLTPSPEPSVLGDFDLDLGDTSWAAATAAEMDNGDDAHQSTTIDQQQVGDDSVQKSEWAARSEDELEAERVAAEEEAAKVSKTKRVRSKSTKKKDPNEPTKKRGRPRKIQVEKPTADVGNNGLDESMKVSHLGTTARIGAKGGSKKNRNPHVSLDTASADGPGSGHSGAATGAAGGDVNGSPQCSHCGSMSTPLWRRGPNDELLCNACGLYQKLHNKSRPLEFLTQATSAKRAANGAAAQAAASGVPPQCHNCAATSTPMWRKDPNGNLCCNACTLYYKLHNTNRPSSLANKRRKSSAPNSQGTKTEPATPLTAVSQLPSPDFRRASTSMTTPVEQQQQQDSSNSLADHHAEPHSNSTSTTASPLDNSDLMTLPRPLSPAVVNGFGVHHAHHAHQWNAGGHYPVASGGHPNLPVPSPVGLAARLSASPGRASWPSLPDPSSTATTAATTTGGQYHFVQHSSTRRPMSPFSISNDRTPEPNIGLVETRQDESFVRGR
ncbi:hypothetical protein ACM66B_001235 [Microbotryomycetes sp. NB124-2]